MDRSAGQLYLVLLVFALGTLDFDLHRLSLKWYIVIRAFV